MTARTPAAGTSFLGDASRPSRPSSALPSGSASPFTHISAPTPERTARRRVATTEDVEDVGGFGRVSDSARSSVSSHPVASPDFPRTLLVPGTLDNDPPSGVQPPREIQPSTFVESPRPRPADNSSQTALPPGWSAQHSPPVTPSPADWFCPVEVSTSGAPVYVPQPVATSTPWKSNDSPEVSAPANSSVSAEEIRLAAKEAVDKVHLRDLVDESGRFKAHLRKPAEAQATFNDLNARDAIGNFGTLFEETNIFIAEDLDPRDIIDAADLEGKESRYRIKARAMLRINYIVEGLESLVNQMLRLEDANRKWKTDHAGSLMSTLRASASRGLISDAFRVVQYRAAKAVTLIHQRRALHDGMNYPDSVKSTVSDFSQHVRASNSKRMMIDKWLDHPDIFSNLTPEYQAVVLRRLGNSEGVDPELANLQIPPDQRFRWPPLSLLVTPVVHGASVSMAGSAVHPSRTSSAARVELDITRASPSVPSEPSSPIMTKGSVRFPPTVDTRPRYSHRSSHANSDFTLPQVAEDVGRKVQFQDPPHSRKDSAAPGLGTPAPELRSSERRSSAPWPRGHSIALPESAAAQTLDLLPLLDLQPSPPARTLRYETPRLI
ncbi:uncharacterized protein C8Q71DRAFT_727093 [Rhodofomes roseus]|uniref:Uncharacterized protein n=1 Tax=Rhodofomes roseus TaxID=34475 RepID=A0ABQ8K2V2_9APHY|nr:uncharacterized protein C8Q71DRAFT_727093 [Rhodofomes roseus]KAH9830883.1 hypothetical protein C8Q71DRAFT_727093 [Rhodofomes roseus]